MNVFRSNTILDFFKSGPALRCNLFFPPLGLAQKRGFSLRSGLEFQVFYLSKTQIN